MNPQPREKRPPHFDAKNYSGDTGTFLLTYTITSAI